MGQKGSEKDNNKPQEGEHYELSSTLNLIYDDKTTLLGGVTHCRWQHDDKTETKELEMIPDILIFSLNRLFLCLILRIYTGNQN